MIVVTTMSQFMNRLPKNKLVGSCGYYRKNTGGHTPAHETLITAQRDAGAEFLYASYWEFRPMRKVMAQSLGYEDAGDDSDGIFDQQYCVDWCESHGIDMVFVPDRADLLRILVGMDKPAAKAWVESWFGAGGFNHPVKSDLLQLKYQIFTNYVAAVLFGLHVNFKAQSIVNGYMDFAFIDFLRRSGWVDTVIVLPIVYRPDGLPEQSKWNNFSGAQLAVLAQVIPAMDSVGYDNMSDFTAWVQAVKAAVDATGATVLERPGWERPIPPETFIYQFTNASGPEKIIEVYVTLPGVEKAVSLSKVLV